MNGPTDAVLAIHNAFRRDIELIDAAALDAARGKPGLEATVERFRFLNEVLEWHAHGEDVVISPLLESVAPSVYETYERDHRALDLAFDDLKKAVSVRDPLETARATKAFKFHLDLHLDKEDADMYRLIRERVPVPEQGTALGLMASHAPQDRFPEIVAWMFPLIGQDDREHDPLVADGDAARGVRHGCTAHRARGGRRLARARPPHPGPRGRAMRNRTA